jgi:hypothetical protein
MRPVGQPGTVVGVHVKPTGQLGVDVGAILVMVVVADPRLKVMAIVLDEESITVQELVAMEVQPVQEVR